MITLQDLALRAGVSTATVSRVLGGRGGISDKTRERVMEAVQALDYRNVPSLRDVARLAGVSQSTVSNVLNGRAAGEGSRKAVLRAAAELRYRPRATAAPLPRSVVLAMGEIPQNLHQSVNEAALALGFNVLSMPLDTYEPEAVVQHLEKGWACGAILFHVNDAALVRRCVALAPTVQCGAYLEVPGSYVVAIDYERAACELAEELLSVGKTRIRFFGDSDPGGRPSRYARAYAAGVRRALAERGLPEDRAEVVDLGRSALSGEYGRHADDVARWIAEPRDRRPDALLFMNGSAASAYVNLLGMAGIRIPEDVAVASLLGGRHDRQCRPYLTSLQPPLQDLGAEAMQVVADLADGKRARPNLQLFPHRIRFGGSTRKELCPYGFAED